MRFAFLLLISAFVTLGAQSLWASDTAPLCEAPPSRAPSSVTKPNGVTVIEVSPTVDASSLRRSGFTVRSLAQASDPWDGPSPSLRDRLLHNAGLWSYVSSWDQLARDQIFLRAQHYSVTKLATKYPQISRSRLTALQNAIAKEKRRMAAAGAK